MNTSYVLKYGHQTVLQTLDGLPESEWGTGGVCGVWSVKDVVAHLASYEEVLVEILTSLSSGGPTPLLDQFNDRGRDFNAIQIPLRQGKTPAEVLAGYSHAHDRVMELTSKIPADTPRRPGTIPWYGMEYALDDFIVYANYWHKREHASQIAVYRDHIQK